MRTEFLSIIVLTIFVSPLIKCDQTAESLAKLQMYLAAYQGKLTSTIGMVKDNKLSEGGLELNKVKSTLEQMTSFVQSDAALQSVPGIKELGGQLTKLSEITKLMNLDNLVEKIKGVFDIIGQVTNKIQTSAGGAAAVGAQAMG